MRALHTLARVLPVLLAEAALLGGCSAVPGDPDGSLEDSAVPAEGTLRIGSGERDFTPIEDGDVLLIARGCQGSQHVWITLQSEDMDPRGMVVELSLLRAADEVLVSAQFRLRLSFTADATGTYAQLTGLTLQIPEPDTAIGQDLVLRGRLEDRSGAVASDERRVRVEWGTEVCSSPGG